MAEDIYEPSVTHLQGKTVLHNIHHVEPIIVKKFPKGFFDRYKVVTLCCDIIHINGFGFLHTISRKIMFATASMIKIEK